MIKINLAPPQARTRLGLATPGGRLGVILGVVLALVLGWLGWTSWSLSSEIDRSGLEIAETQRELDRLRAVIAEGQRFKGDKEELERRVAAIELVARNQARPVYLLESVANALVRDVWLTQVEEKGSQLRLSGNAHSSTAVSDFMAALKASGRFKDVDLLESRQDLNTSPRLIGFVVSCRFEI
ncbi:MAG: PilN domain-containing protein [Candidatus Rokubacteria bacterium]|nr:PilN domain-containing protein [Candidatus Rokubacteria bacterium]